MKLYFNHASPFSRKCRVLILELGIGDRIELIDMGLISPVKPNAQVISSNPVGKVPSLLLNDGESLQDSRVICEYLKVEVGLFAVFSQ